MLHYEARIESRRAELAKIVAMVEQFASANDLPEPVACDVNVALDEALSNIVAYGYEDQSGPIVVRLGYGNDEVRIEVEDAGRPFNPLQAPPPDFAADLTQRQVGGLGIHFIKSLMDDVSYQRHDGKNHLRMVRHVTRSQPAKSRAIGGVAILEPEGRIDTAGAISFCERLDELMRDGARNLLIDLRHIIYVSSAGFRALLVARKRMDAVEGRIILCGVSPYLRRLFEIAHFTDLFEICATRDEGLARAHP
jgi:serine/threonine-protein kinase RsbW